MLDILVGYRLEQQRDLGRRSTSQTLDARSPRSVEETNETPDLPKAQSHQSDAVNVDSETAPPASSRGRFGCRFCGTRFYRPTTRDNHEKQHEHGHPRRYPRRYPGTRRQQALWKQKLSYDTRKIGQISPFSFTGFSNFFLQVDEEPHCRCDFSDEENSIG